MVSMTRARVEGATSSGLLRTFEAVPMDTCAICATARIVARARRRAPSVIRASKMRSMTSTRRVVALASTSETFRSGTMPHAPQSLRVSRHGYLKHWASRSSQCWEHLFLEEPEWREIEGVSDEVVGAEDRRRQSYAQHD